MPQTHTDSGFADIGGARIYYEIAGEGDPLVMLHAGVADSRQWDHEFAHFAQRYRVLRFDQRGFGKSEPAAGEYSYLGNLVALLEHLRLDQPLIAMGCSMGGGVAMNLALAHPARVKALIMVASAPSGLQLDVPESPLVAEIVAADQAGDLERVCELETQLWFDGVGRTPAQVDPQMRKLLYEMNRIALVHDAKQLGTRLPDSDLPAAPRLGEINIPVLVIAGGHDNPYILAAADYMEKHLPSARKALIADAAHLPNMEHPHEFQQIVTGFLQTI
jgi:pimeloyl-ACP methyl ester carboxylesterase